MLSEITEKLTAYMIGKGITPDEELVLGGDICRFHIQGDSPGKRNGWCALNLGEFPFASFGSWKTGKQFSWQLKKPSTPEETFAARKAQQEASEKYKEDQARKHKLAAETANILWNKAVPADRSHAYLWEKEIQAHGVRQLDDALLVPMYHGAEIVSLQAIYPTGQKIFLKGGQVKGCYFPLQNTPSDVDTIYLGEGFATMATLIEKLADEYSLFTAAFTAGNLTSVAIGLREEHSGAEIIICADNDQWTKENPGITKARQAGLMVGARVIYPDFQDLDTSNRPSDFNDYIHLGGDLCL